MDNSKKDNECKVNEETLGEVGVIGATVNTDEAVSDNKDRSVDYVPEGKYDAYLYKISKNETLTEMMKISSHAIVLITAYALFMRLVTLIDTPIEIAKISVICGVPFVLVSILRAVIKAPRPYETYEFYLNPLKKKSAGSFPSRHVFSVFVIAVSLIPTWTFLGVGLMALGVLLAFFRISLGLHFIRDTVAGALIGVASGVVGLAVMSFI